MMSVDEFVRASLVFSVVILPALAVTARFALKPVVDAVLRLKEGGALPSSNPAASLEVRQLRDDVAELQRTVRELQEAESFNRALAESKRPALAGPSVEH
jgi:hypothetical protein